MKAHGVRATFALSADLLARAAPLAEAIAEDGHEIAAAGLNGDAIHHGALDEDEERRRIEAVRAAFDRAGLAPKTWLSPARQQSFNTPDLLVEHGFDICLDWEIDQVPVSMRTRSGPLTCLPLHNELDDYKLLIERTQEEAVWARQIAEAREALLAEADDRGAQVFGFSLTPFVTGQPFRYPRPGRGPRRHRRRPTLPDGNGAGNRRRLSRVTRRRAWRRVPSLSLPQRETFA